MTASRVDRADARDDAHLCRTEGNPRESRASGMSLFAFCIAGTALSYLMGLRTPGRGYGTVTGWVTSLAIGVFLGLLYYLYSAYGLLFSLDSLF